MFSSITAWSLVRGVGCFRASADAGRCRTSLPSYAERLGSSPGLAVFEHLLDTPCRWFAAGPALTSSLVHRVDMCIVLVLFIVRRSERIAVVAIGRAVTCTGWLRA